MLPVYLVIVKVKWSVKLSAKMPFDAVKLRLN